MSYVWYLMSSILHLLMCLCFVMLMYFRDLIFEFNVSRSYSITITSCYLFLFLSLFLFLFILTFEKPPHLPADIKRREVYKARMSCAVSPPKKPSLEPKPSKLDRRVLTPPHDTHLTHHLRLLVPPKHASRETLGREEVTTQLANHNRVRLWSRPTQHWNRTS